MTRAAFILPLLILHSTKVGMSEDWPAFRGRNGAAVAGESPLPAKFDAAAWSLTIPFGRSSPVVHRQKIYFSASEGDRLFLIAVNSRTGKEIWRYSKTRARTNEIDGKRNDPASSTPAVDDTGLYAFFVDFGLIAINHDGKLLWELPLGPFINNYGMASSPVISEESVYLQLDQLRGSALISVNKRNGAIRWKQERGATREGWATPLITRTGEVIALSSNGLEAFDAETGAGRWLVPAPNSLMIPSPTLYGDRIIATIRGSERPTGPGWEKVKLLDGDGDSRLDIDEASKAFTRESFGIADPDRDGYITEAEWNMFVNRGVGEFGITCVRLADQRVLWRQKRALPYVPSPLVYDGFVYTVRTGGFLLSMDAERGEIRKEGRLPEAGGDYFASLVAGDRKIYAASAEGKVSVIKPGADWEVISLTDLGEPIAATPAIADGAIFIRTSQRLLRFRASGAP